MKNEIEVSTWEKCEAKLLEIQRDLETRSKAGRRTIPVLFRGQSDTNWSLATTLERKVCREYGISDYCRIMGNIGPAIEAFTGRVWKLPQYQSMREIQKVSGNRHDILRILRENLSYSFLAHLRHHGFPSPLLDWTTSPYIAAYFAFANARAHKCGRVAIYVFSEQTDDKKTARGSDEAAIDCLGPIVQTHRRHFLQKSHYTICTEFNPNGGWVFTSHQKLFNRERTDQHILWKIVAPACERMRVLGILDNFNLNAFSLFTSEEKLLETPAFREIEASALNHPIIFL